MLESVYEELKLFHNVVKSSILYDPVNKEEDMYDTMKLNLSEVLME